MTARPYQICVRCVMDTSDPDIVFDAGGVCNHCKAFEVQAKAFPTEPAEKKRQLDEIVAAIKERGKGHRYDCLIGVSGGVDSTYCAWLVKELGLRPLAVHFDNGWNSELAVKNIENIVSKLGIDLFTYVMDWEEFRDLQLSFLKAATPDGEGPTDHGILAILIQKAVEEKIGYVISGTNNATEGILPNSYSYGGFDWRYINGVQKIFGTRKLITFPHFSFTDRLSAIFVRKIRNIGILNYVDYDKKKAIETIERELGWRNYGGKHYESVYTRFFQGYILPRKFNVDKRRAHASALICSGQITRDQALEQLKSDPYPSPELMREDREFVIKKFDLTEAEFDAIMASPNKSFLDYPSYYRFYQRIAGVVRFAKRTGLIPKRVGI